MKKKKLPNFHFNTGIARQVIEDVFKRLEMGAEKYKGNYFWTDYKKEVYWELLDLVGYTLLEVVRIIESIEGKKAKIGDVSWRKFLENQETSYLKEVERKIHLELVRRKDFEG